MVELLLKGSDGAVRISPAPNPDRPSKTGPLREPAVPNSTSIGAKPVEEPVSGWTGNKTATAFTSDPSYVFFRQIPDSEVGPLGALGVPLTAGRSVAVDPRTTPLGFPVFISTEGQTLSSRMSRLMFAQDTGGAIKGPVRGDLFWGHGKEAADGAGAMNARGRYYLLLPRSVAARVTGAADAH